jgi:chromosome segregation ATPase
MSELKSPIFPVYAGIGPMFRAAKAQVGSLEERLEETQAELRKLETENTRLLEEAQTFGKQRDHMLGEIERLGYRSQCQEGRHQEAVDLMGDELKRTRRERDEAKCRLAILDAHFASLDAEHFDYIAELEADCRRLSDEVERMRTAVEHTFRPSAGGTRIIIHGEPSERDYEPEREEPVCGD